MDWGNTSSCTWITQRETNYVEQSYATDTDHNCNPSKGRAEIRYIAMWCAKFHIVSVHTEDLYIIIFLSRVWHFSFRDPFINLLCMYFFYQSLHWVRKSGINSCLFAHWYLACHWSGSSSLTHVLTYKSTGTKQHMEIPRWIITRRCLQNSRRHSCVSNDTVTDQDMEIDEWHKTMTRTLLSVFNSSPQDKMTVIFKRQHFPFPFTWWKW